MSQYLYFYWQKDGYSHYKIFDSNDKLIGDFGAGKCIIGDKQFYTSLDEGGLLICCQDKEFNKSYCNYRKQEFINETYCRESVIDGSYQIYLQQNEQIIGDIINQNTCFKKKGTLSVFGSNTDWEMTLYQLLYIHSLQGQSNYA